MRAELTDSRRLTGANFFWDHPSAIIDVSIDGPSEPLIGEWQRTVRQLLEALGREQEQTCFRVYQGGASLLISAAIDALYTTCELNEVAWKYALDEMEFGAPNDNAGDLSADIKRLRTEFDAEANPALLALQSAAAHHGVPFLWDDDEVSAGYGATACIWSADSLPAADDVDWQSIHSIPLALVTGTNGKSTTVRMTAAIMNAGGYKAGLTSTDFIRVGDRTIDKGDYSGTGGARMLMRQGDVEMAVLEVARGGLLRRGLGVERAQAACITNVAADHLGEYGINTVEELIPAKFIVHRALKGDDPLILNADDDGVVAFAESLDNRLAWFSLEAGNPVIRAQLLSGGTACYLKDGWLVAATGGAEGQSERNVIPVKDIPPARGGAVRYNVSNALAALSIAVSLGIPDDAIRAGLSVFKGDEHDNPGRGNWFEHNGIRILVDFAHNEHGMIALADSVRQVDADRVVLLMGQAGDRLDKDIRDLTRAACSMRPDHLLISELPGYERGREPMTVPGLIRKFALESGISEESIDIFACPKEATEQALMNALPGDLLVLLALTQRQEALALIHEYLKANNG
jgi:UDP-N-acetylmuramyl tripeptide synthase